LKQVELFEAVREGLTPEAKRLLDKFEVVAGAPGGGKRLRELILELAVRGNLVPQLPSEGNSSQLLVSLRAERERLFRMGKIRRGQEPSPVSTEEALFDIPSSWAWVRFGEIGDWGAGATPNRSNARYYGGSVLWLKSGELNDGYLDTSEETVTDLALAECSLRMNEPGDVLVAMYGATIGKVAILRVHATTNQAICACTVFGGFYNEYLARVLKAFRHVFVGQGEGGAQPNISKIKIVNTPLPLPPLAEQKRIVAKVDALMKLCDDLEARQAKQREVASRLSKAALDALASAEGPEELAASWQRVARSFETLSSKPESTDELRQAVLEMAVRGRLVPQNRMDQGAVELLAQIAIERQESSKGKLNALEQTVVDNLAFDIPQSWCWTSWGALVLLTESGWSPQCESRARVGDEWGVLKVSAVSWDSFDPDANKALPQGIQPRAEHAVQAGDFLMSRANTSELVGRSVVVGVAPKNLMLSDKIVRCSFSSYVERRFVNYYNRTAVARDHYRRNASGTSDSMKNISRDVILGMPVPLPPLAEQKRIVAKVDALMTLCDALEASLRRAEDTARKLADALVAELLA
jgi:type I restriction enzyme S subunit